jgi:hypothetical protein
MPTGSNLVLGQANTASDPTDLTIPASTPYGFVVRYPGAQGFVGNQFLGAGLLGIGNRGVSGISLNDFGTGVAGLGTRVGVVGDSSGFNSVGARGNADFLGVVGSVSTSVTSKLVAAVHGDTSNTMGIGVNGQSATFIGVRGLAGRVPTTAGAIGVAGFGTLGGHGVLGVASPPAFAGVFFGNFAVANGTKSAIVPFPDGSHRMLYTIESPENWFEDFGTARLVRGRGTIRVDRRFRAVIRGPYHVFLTPEGDCRGLYVARKSSGAVEVRENQGGRSSIAFSYRIVARRRDVATPRFARATLPKLPRGVDAPIESPAPPRTPTVKEVRARIVATRSRRRRRR